MDCFRITTGWFDIGTMSVDILKVTKGQGKVSDLGWPVMTSCTCMPFRGILMPWIRICYPFQASSVVSCSSFWVRVRSVTSHAWRDPMLQWLLLTLQTSDAPNASFLELWHRNTHQTIENWSRITIVKVSSRYLLPFCRNRRGNLKKLDFSENLTFDRS